MAKDKPSPNTSSGGDTGTTAADSAAAAADQTVASDDQESTLEKVEKSIGRVVVLAEKKVGNFITRVKQDAKRVWKEIEEIGKGAGK